MTAKDIGYIVLVSCIVLLIVALPIVGFAMSFVHNAAIKTAMILPYIVAGFWILGSKSTNANEN